MRFIDGSNVLLIFLATFLVGACAAPARNQPKERPLRIVREITINAQSVEDPDGEAVGTLSSLSNTRVTRIVSKKARAACRQAGVKTGTQSFPFYTTQMTNFLYDGKTYTGKLTIDCYP